MDKVIDTGWRKSQRYEEAKKRSLSFYINCEKYKITLSVFKTILDPRYDAEQYFIGKAYYNDVEMFQIDADSLENAQKIIENKILGLNQIFRYICSKF